jgi:hypothetical protein
VSALLLVPFYLYRLTEGAESAEVVSLHREVRSSGSIHIAGVIIKRFPLPNLSPCPRDTTNYAENTIPFKARYLP